MSDIAGLFLGFFILLMSMMDVKRGYITGGRFGSGKRYHRRDPRRMVRFTFWFQIAVMSALGSSISLWAAVKILRIQ